MEAVLARDFSATERNIYIYIKVKTKENSEGDRIVKEGGHANEIFTSTRVTSLMNEDKKKKNVKLNLHFDVNE